MLCRTEVGKTFSFSSRFIRLLFPALVSPVRNIKRNKTREKNVRPGLKGKKRSKLQLGWPTPSTNMLGVVENLVGSYKQLLDVDVSSAKLGVETHLTCWPDSVGCCWPTMFEAHARSLRTNLTWYKSQEKNAYSRLCNCYISDFGVWKNMFLASRRFVIGDHYFVRMHGKCPNVKHQIDDDRLYCYAKG